VDMLPAQSPQLLGPRAGEQRDHDVGVQPIERGLGPAGRVIAVVPSVDSASSRWRSASPSRRAIVTIPSSGGEAIASDSSTRPLA
jgi:hypothetical protein